MLSGLGATDLLGTAEVSVLGLEELAAPAEEFGAAVDRLTADMAATAEGVRSSIQGLDEWEDLFGEPRPPTPQPATPRHLFSMSAHGPVPAEFAERGLPAEFAARPRSASSAGTYASDVPTEESEPPSFVARAFDVVDEIAELDGLGLRYADQPDVAAALIWENARAALTPTASSVGDEGLDDD